MRKKFSIDAKKVFAFEMTAPLETILVAKVVKERGRGPFLAWNQVWFSRELQSV